MEVYILDSLLRRTQVIDRFESVIWTERVDAWGDFELITNSTPETRGQFATGTMLAQNESFRVMTVETVEDTTDADGRALLKVKGRSLEAILEDRVVKQSMSSLTTNPKWVISGSPKQVITTMFDAICRQGVLSIHDKIPFLQPGTIFQADTIPEIPDPILHEQEPASLYSAIKSLCEMYNMGFRLVRNFDTSTLYFDVYTGIDRTTSQTQFAPVVFAPNLDNLQNTTSLTTIQGAKNTAYVFSEQGFQIVYPLNVDPEIDGFERNVLLVQADSLPGNPTADDVAVYLAQKGKEELSRNRGFSAFDGEINQNSEYRYGTHYQLGDLVELRNSDGVANNMRVTEQIFVSDGEGERSYPTLTIYQFINTGSWLSWNSNKVWADLGAETWASLP